MSPAFSQDFPQRRTEHPPGRVKGEAGASREAYEALLAEELAKNQRLLREVAERAAQALAPEDPLVPRIHHFCQQARAAAEDATRAFERYSR